MLFIHLSDIYLAPEELELLDGCYRETISSILEMFFFNKKNKVVILEHMEKFKPMQILPIIL